MPQCWRYRFTGGDLTFFEIGGEGEDAGHDTRALQAWLGRRNIQHTVRYTELAPDRFKNFWRD